MQLQFSHISKGVLSSEYTGIKDCFRKLYTEGGVINFYKGNYTNVLRFFVTQALNFSFKDMFQKYFKKEETADGKLVFLTFNILSGGAAGATTQLITYPLDYARTRLANDIKNSLTNHQRKYLGLINCLKKTYSSDGAAGLYRGFAVSCVCMVIYRGLYFGLYDSYKSSIPNNIFASFALGYTATIASGALSYPLDTIRRRMMMTSG